MALILTGSDTADLLSYREAIAIARQSLLEWGEHEDLNPPRQRIHVGKSRASVHPGGSPSEAVMGVAIHGETLDIRDGKQATLHYPPVCALYDLRSRELLALLMGGETNSVLGTIGRLRTAALTALGALTLARPNVERLALFGSGKQARYHLEALMSVMRFTEVRVFSPNREHRREFASEMSAAIDADLKATDSPEENLAGADVVVAATNTIGPVFPGRALQAGMHVSSIGGSNIGLIRSGMLSQKRAEVDDTTLRRADRLVILSQQQAEQDEQGEVVDPIRRGAATWDRTVELKDVLAGKAKGRESADQITVFLNNAGTGIVDIAIAGRLVQEAKRRGRGQVFEHPDVMGEQPSG